MSTENVKLNWSKVIVRDEQGVASEEQTMARLLDAYRCWVSENEVGVAEVGAAVKTAIEKFPQAEFMKSDMPGLIRRVLSEVNVPLGADTRFSKRIADFIRNESARFEDSKGTEGALHIIHGRSGGVMIVNDAYRAKFQSTLKPEVSSEQA